MHAFRKLIVIVSDFVIVSSKWIGIKIYLRRFIDVYVYF
jgi:hypothetical protein